MDKGGNVEKVTADIKNAVDRVRSLPEDAERPVVSQLSNRREVIKVAIYGQQEDKVLKELGERVRDRLIADDEITQVELAGVRPSEISIEIPQATLRAHGLTLDAVADRVRRHAIQLPGGAVKTRGGELLLRTDERRTHGHEFEDVPIVVDPTGVQLTLAELGKIRDGFADIDDWSSFNGKPAILVEVFRVGDQTPLAIAGKVKEHMAEFEETLPAGVSLGLVSDRSEMYRGRMELLLKNAFLGLILVLIVLGLFLEAGLAFWVTLGIPISFSGALLLMPLTGASVNMVSLFAFIVTLGIVVDDAIVVGENVYEMRQRGAGLMEAAIRGAREVAVPVTFSILTTVVAFAPMFFVPGFMGKIFYVIPSVVITVLLISLVESVFVLPAHLGHKLRVPDKGLMRWLLLPLWVLRLLSTPLRLGADELRRFFTSALELFIHRLYSPFARLAMEWRYLTLGVGVATLVIVAGLVAGGRIEFSFMPKIESDNITATALLPYGAPASRTEEIQQLLIDGALEVMDEEGGFDDVARGMYSRLGSAMAGGGPVAQVRVAPGGHVTSVRVRLLPLGERPVTAPEFVERWREAVGEIPGLDLLSFKSTIGSGAGAAVDIQLSHRDVHQLQRAAQDVAAALGEYAGVHDIDAGFSRGKPQLDLELRPEAAALGVNAATLGRQVRSTFYGAEALRQQRGRDEVRVFVRLPERERETEHDIESMIVRTPVGGEMTLGQAAEVERGHAAMTISRDDGRRVISVTAEVDDKIANAQKVTASIIDGTLPAIMERYPGLKWQLEGEQRERKEGMQALLIGFLIAQLAIFALLAVPFRSYIQPAVVMTAIPFGVVGAVLGHIIMGFELSIISMFGIVALGGVVVNDSLVLVHAANRFRDGDPDHGLAPIPVAEAILAAGVRRFRPILLTSLTTFFGLMPMILETSVQARFLVPMAISLGFGVLFATFIILILVPCFYLIVEDIRWILGFRRDDPETRQEEPSSLGPVVPA